MVPQPDEEALKSVHRRSDRHASPVFYGALHAPVWVNHLSKLQTTAAFRELVHRPFLLFWEGIQPRSIRRLCLSPSNDELNVYAFPVFLASRFQEEREIAVGKLLRQWIEERLEVEQVTKKTRDLLERLAVLEETVSYLTKKLK